jgi:hypothetical protein
MLYSIPCTMTGNKSESCYTSVVSDKVQLQAVGIYCSCSHDYASLKCDRLLDFMIIVLTSLDLSYVCVF